MLVVKATEVVEQEEEPLQLEEVEGVCFSAYCSYDISSNKIAADVPIPTDIWLFSFNQSLRTKMKFTIYRYNNSLLFSFVQLAQFHTHK